MMRTFAGTMLVALCLASTAGAVDGAFEINQACASGPGCFTGDSSGLPVQIGTRGSYRLTSNLTAANQSTSLISITAPGVHLDLNGFALLGTNGYSGPGSPCTAPGSAIGVNATANDVSVSNGHVRGIGSVGIALAGANSRVERVIAEHNCGDGIRVGFAGLVIETIARANRQEGIEADQTSRVIDSVADINNGTGIHGPNGNVDVDGCVANANGGYGVLVGSNSRVHGCQAGGNGIHGIGLLGSSQVTESIANGNTSRGISAPGGVGSGDSTAVGLVVVTGNAGDTNLSGGVTVGCNLVGATRVCPP
jgi:hypothetical protein